MRSGKLKAYLRSGYRYVDGWLQPAAAQAIVLLSEEQRRIGVEGGIAEIGVHHGKLFILLYLLSDGNEPAIAIDLFSQQELNLENSGAGDLERFKQNLKSHADTSRLLIQEGDSTKLNAGDLLKLGRGPLRLISIDGGHTPEITAHDFATAEGALAPGGIIILDDCFNEMWPGVSEGVFRYFSGPRSIVPFCIGAGKTFFCHPAAVDKYDMVLRTMKASRTIEYDFLGSRVVCLNFSRPTLAYRISKTKVWPRIRSSILGTALRRTYRTIRSRLPH
jgi:hypothetical protein